MFYISPDRLSTFPSGPHKLIKLLPLCQPRRPLPLCPALYSASVLFSPLLSPFAFPSLPLTLSWSLDAADSTHSYRSKIPLVAQRPRTRHIQSTLCSSCRQTLSSSHPSEPEELHRQCRRLRQRSRRQARWRAWARGPPGGSNIS